MGLKWYFRNEPTSSFKEHPSFTTKSSCKPPQGNPSLDLFLSQIKKELFEVCNSNSGYSNFSKGEWQCMRLLANDSSIVIKKADKGSCVVVGDREDYIAEASKQLNNESVYKSVKFKDKILQDLVEKSNGIFKGLKQKGKITEKRLKACVRYFLSNFYFSPNDSPSKTMKDFFSTKKLFLFSRYSHFCICVFPSFSLCQPLL